MLNFFFFYNGSRVYLKHYGTKFLNVTYAKNAAGKFTVDDFETLVDKRLVLKGCEDPIYWFYELS